MFIRINRLQREQSMEWLLFQNYFLVRSYFFHDTFYWSNSDLKNYFYYAQWSRTNSCTKFVHQIRAPNSCTKKYLQNIFHVRFFFTACRSILMLRDMSRCISLKENTNGRNGLLVRNCWSERHWVVTQKKKNQAQADHKKTDTFVSCKKATEETIGCHFNNIALQRTRFESWSTWQLREV